MLWGSTSVDGFSMGLEEVWLVWNVGRGMVSSLELEEASATPRMYARCDSNASSI
jgi:hypothetical protein